MKSSNGDAVKAPEPRKRGRWDQTIDDQFVPAKKAAGAVTPTWNDVEVREKFYQFFIFVFISFNFLTIFRKRLHSELKLKHLEQLHARNVFGMRHRHMFHRHHRWRRQPMRRVHVGIVGTKHLEPSERHRVTIPVGWKLQKPIVVSKIESLSRQRRQRDDHVGMKHHRMPHHR